MNESFVSDLSNTFLDMFYVSRDEEGIINMNLNYSALQITPFLKVCFICDQSAFYSFLLE